METYLKVKIAVVIGLLIVLTIINVMVSIEGQQNLNFRLDNLSQTVEIRAVCKCNKNNGGD